MISRVPISALPPDSFSKRPSQMQCTWPLASPSAMPTPSFLGIVSPGSPLPLPNRCPLSRQRRHPTLQPHPPGQGDVVGRPRYSMYPLLAIWPLICWLPERPLQRSVLSHLRRHRAHNRSSSLPSMPCRTSYAKDRWSMPSRLPRVRQLRRRPPSQLALLSEACRSATEQRARANKLVRGSPPS